MYRILSLHIILAMLAVAQACDSRHSADAAQPATAAADTTAQPRELALPQVPPTIADPQQRAAFAVEHFWDDLDFTDTVRSLNRDFMEQNFANYAALFSMVPEDDLQQSITHMMSRAEADTAAFHLMGRIAEHYLYDPNSPMLNEDMYAMFLPSMISEAGPEGRLRLEYQQECIAKNRPGSEASDFAYTDRNGARHTLRTTPCDNRLMVIFFDPDCEECEATLGRLKQLQLLSDMIADHRTTVLAIYTEGKADGWQKAKKEIPSTWLLGNDLSRVDDNEIYVLRAMPTIYVLDSHHRVVLKDVPVQAALRECAAVG